MVQSSVCAIVDRNDSDEIYGASLNAHGKTWQDVFLCDFIIQNSDKKNDPQHKLSNATRTHQWRGDTDVSTDKAGHAGQVRDHQ